MELFTRQVCFYSPPKSNIVIFDETNSHYITDFILEGRPSFVFNVRPENIYISPSVIYNFLKSLQFFDIKAVSKKLLSLRLALGGIKKIYLFALFKCMKPKVVITFIDNSSGFHWLAKNFRSAQFFAIQNGNRTIDQLEKEPQYHQHFFCFGIYEKDLYTRFGYSVKNYHPVGSLVADYYKHNIENDDFHVSRYDLCVVSVWPVHNKEQFYTLKLMDTLLARYIQEHKIRAAVSMRLSSDYIYRPHHYISGYSDEKSYYQSLYGSNIELIEYNREKKSTYRVMENSEVVVGFLTTAVREAFGWGKKVLYINFCGDNKFVDFDPMIVFTEPDYKALENRLNELRNEPYDEYIARTKDYASYVMNYDPDCPPHIYIRKKIEEYL